jgi:hypothetical protein
LTNEFSSGAHQVKEQNCWQEITSGQPTVTKSRFVSHRMSFPSLTFEQQINKLLLLQLQTTFYVAIVTNRTTY